VILCISCWLGKLYCISYKKVLRHWCAIGVPPLLADFEIIPIPNLPNLTDPRIPSPNRGICPLPPAPIPPINLASNSLDRNDFKICQKRLDPYSTPVLVCILDTSRFSHLSLFSGQSILNKKFYIFFNLLLF
jgi:hypothetical protein